MTDAADANDLFFLSILPGYLSYAPFSFLSLFFSTEKE
jgi:hypothetical protein